LPRELIYYVNCDQGFTLTNATGGYYLKAGTPLHRFTDPNQSTPPTWWTSRDVVDRGIFNWPITYLPPQPNFPYPIPTPPAVPSAGTGTAPQSWLPLGYSPPYSNAAGPLVGNYISSSDSRYAWIPVGYQFSYGLDCAPPGTIKVWILALKVRNQSQYTNKDAQLFDDGKGNPVSTFLPKIEFFYLRDTGTKPNYLTFIKWTFNGKIVGYPTDPANNPPQNCTGAYDPPEAAEGAYVFLADDRIAVPINDLTFPNPTINNLPIIHPGQANGRFYRLGAKRGDLGPGVWELAPGDGPGHDMSSATSLPGADNIVGTNDDLEVNDNIPPRTTKTAFGEMNSTPPSPPSGNYVAPAMGYIVGKGYTDPANPASGFEGPAQDLIAFPITVTVPQ